LDQAMSLFDRVNKMQDCPLGTPIPDLMRQAEDRLNGILAGLD
jgi:hypothetical protein